MPHLLVLLIVEMLLIQYCPGNSALVILVFILN